MSPSDHRLPSSPNSIFRCKRLSDIGVGLFILFSFSFAPQSAFAHHPLDRKTPGNVIEGLLSGIGHPVIGIDHLAFIIAVGILAALMNRGLLIPIGFVAGSMVGVILHLQLFTIPASELFISVTVLTVGLLVMLPERLSVRWSTTLGITAGIFHGYAYAEAIVGANMAILASYISGLAFVQLFIALACYFTVTKFVRKDERRYLRAFRISGLAIAGIGTVFTYGAVM